MCALEDQLKQLILRVEQSESEIKQVWRNRLDRTLQCMRSADYRSLLRHTATQTDSTTPDNDSNISEQLVLRAREPEADRHCDDEVQLHSPLPSVTSAICKSPILSKAVVAKRIRQSPKRTDAAQSADNPYVPKSTVSLAEHPAPEQATSFSTPMSARKASLALPTTPVQTTLEIIRPTLRSDLLVGHVVRSSHSQSRSVSPVTPSIRIELSKDVHRAAPVQTPTPEPSQVLQLPAPARAAATGPTHNLNLTADESSKLKHLVTAKFFSQRKRSDVSSLRTTQLKQNNFNSTMVKDPWDNSWISAEPETVKGSFLKMGKTNKPSYPMSIPQPNTLYNSSKLDLKRIIAFDSIDPKKYQMPTPFHNKRNSEQLSKTVNRQSPEHSHAEPRRSTDCEGFLQRYMHSWKDDDLFNPALDFLYDFTRSGATPANSQVKIARLKLEEAFLQDQLKVEEVVSVVRRIIAGHRQPADSRPFSRPLAASTEPSRRSTTTQTLVVDCVKSLLKYAQLCWLSNTQVLALLSPVPSQTDETQLVAKLTDESRRLKRYYELHRGLFALFAERAKLKRRHTATCQRHSDVLWPQPQMHSVLTADETRELLAVDSAILRTCDALKRNATVVPKFRGFEIEELVDIDLWEARLQANPKSRSTSQHHRDDLAGVTAVRASLQGKLNFSENPAFHNRLQSTKTQN